MQVKACEFENEEALEVEAASMRLVVVIARGPRIAFLGRPGGENLLFWDREDLGRGEWKLMGGHRVWPARPGADESEDAYRPDNAPCKVEQQDQVLTVTGPRDQVLGISRGLRISPAGEALAVESLITNAGDMLYATSAWSLTCTRPRPDTTYHIPLGDGSEWDCFNLVMFRRWGGGHTSPLNDPQIAFTEDELVLTPRGIETKRMLQAPAGSISMRSPQIGLVFTKQVAYQPLASYPLGCNLAFYVGPENFMVEMESMGPETMLKPGAIACARELWILQDA